MRKIAVALLISLFFEAHTQNISSSLQACYPFDGNALNYAVTGSPLNGSLNNVTAVTGHSGLPNTAYSLNGSISSYIELPNQPGLKSDSVFFSGWFYIDALPNEQYLVYTKNNCSYDFEAYSLITYYSSVSNQQVFRVSKSGSACVYAPQAESQTALAIGNWYHVCFYMDNSVIKLYVNAVLEASSTHNIVFDYQSDKTVFLGVTNENNFNLPFTGRIDNVRFYNRELTLQEVNILYTQDPRCNGSESGAPAASFSASKKQVCKGQSVAFTDQSTNNPTSWSWQMPGGVPASSSASNPAVSFPSAGVYTVSLTSSNSQGSSSSAVQTITVSACLSISENNQLPVSIYPNPSHGKLYLRNLAAGTPLIYDVMGRPVSYIKTQVDENTCEINIEDSEPGIYFMKISNKDGISTGTFKIIKN